MGVFPGRHSARLDGDFVVFLIGMRVNRPWKLRRTLSVFRQMRPMVNKVAADPSSGFLGAEYVFLYGGPALLPFWRYFEHLGRGVSNPGEAHLPAWRRFNQ